MIIIHTILLYYIIERTTYRLFHVAFTLGCTICMQTLAFAKHELDIKTINIKYSNAFNHNTHHTNVRTTMYGSSSGVSLRSLLCFIPGLDRRKAWHPKGELRTLVKSLSKEEISTRRLTRKNVQYYGSSSSDEEEDRDSDYHSSKHRFSVEEEDSCRPAFLLLPPRPEESATDDTIDSGVNSKSYNSSKSPPEIVLHLPSDNESNPDHHRHNGGLITDESMDDFADTHINMDSPVQSESTWRSPMVGDSGSESTQQFMTCSEATAAGPQYNSDTETHSDSCSTCVSPESSLTSSLTEESRQPSQNGWNNSQHSSSVSVEVHKQPSEQKDEDCNVEAHFDLVVKPLKVTYRDSDSSSCNIEGSSLHDLCKETDITSDSAQVMPTIAKALQHSCPAISHKRESDTNNKSPALSPGSTDSQRTIHMVHGDKIDAPGSHTSTPKLSLRGLMYRDVDDLSSSNDSRSFSYVSVPKRTFVPDPMPPDRNSIRSEQSDISDTTFWSSDSNIAEEEIANIISRDPSAHQLNSVCDSQETIVREEISSDANNDKGADNESTNRRRFGLDLVVNALVGRSPSPSSRFNPFNIAEPEVDSKQLNDQCVSKGRSVSGFI